MLLPEYLKRLYCTYIDNGKTSMDPLNEKTFLALLSILMSLDYHLQYIENIPVVKSTSKIIEFITQALPS